MIAKYVIAEEDVFEVPFIFPEVVNHHQAIHGHMKILSAGKVVWHEGDLSVSMGSISLNIDCDRERQAKDLELIHNFINKFYY